MNVKVTALSYMYLIMLCINLYTLWIKVSDRTRGCSIMEYFTAARRGNNIVFFLLFALLVMPLLSCGKYAMKFNLSLVKSATLVKHL